MNTTPATLEYDATGLLCPLPVLRANRIGIATGAFRSGVLTCVALEGERRDILQT